MTITSCRYMPEQTTGSGSVEAGNRYTTVHRVESDDMADGPVSAVLQGMISTPDPLPHVYSIFAHGNDRDETVRLLTRETSPPIPTADGLIFYVTSNYAQPDEKSESRATETNPLRWPVRYWLEFNHDTEEVYQDAYGNPVVNFLGLRYPGGVQRTRQRPVLCAAKNYPDLPTVYTYAQSFVDGVNSATYQGATPRTLRVESFTAGEQQESGGIKYYQAVIRLEYREETWDQWLLEESDYTTRLIDVDGTKKLKGATDDDGNPSAEPRMIDPDGFALPAKSRPYYTRWALNRLVNIAQMGI